MQKLIGKGIGASLGLAPPLYSGRAFVALTPKDAEKMPDGDILVTKFTNVDYFEAMTRSLGVVTEVGGRLSHAAITMMELQKPAVVGAAGILGGIKTGNALEFNVVTGEVFAEE